MNIQLSDHFDYKRLLQFTIPSMLMMIFTSIYGVVDGLCVSNFVGKEALAAVNLVWPFSMFCSSIGMMLGTGGAALIARTMGQGEYERAKGLFSMVIVTAILVSVAISVVGVLFMPQIALVLGADEELLPLCVTYGRILTLNLGFFVMQQMFQTLLITAERPNLGFFFMVGAGVANIFLDILFLMVFHWGIEGAAWATFLSCMVGGFGPLLYFLCPNKSLLRFTKPLWDMKALQKICGNGFSEMVLNLSIPLCTMLYNIQLMGMIGQDGVAAYGVINYICMIFMALFIGFLMGVENIVAFHFGAQNHEEVQNLRRRCIHLMLGIGCIMCVGAELTATPLAQFFVGYDETLVALSTHAFRLTALGYLIMGLNALASSFFTAFGNGLVSAIIAFCRTFLFQALSIFLLPLLLGLDGIWLSLLVGECLCLCVSAAYYKKYKLRYQY